VDDQPTILWKLGRNDELVWCQVRLVAYGIEVDLVHGGTVILTRAFETGDEAHAWAEKKRTTRAAQGWEGVPLSPSDQHTKIV
jgi:hypothetical protein